MEGTRNWADPRIDVQSKKIKIVGSLGDGEVPYLPPEIMEGILKRLPVKLLLKFRCVSKSWLSLISSPAFIKTHLNFSSNNPSFTNHRIMHTINDPHFPLRHSSLHSLLLGNETVASVTDYPMKGPDRKVLVVGSCNGVICLSIDKKHIFLWNPSMRTSKKLPPLFVDAEMRKGLKFTCSFGFNECDDDYKVVVILCVVFRSGVKESCINIYSLKADSWKRIKDFKTGFLKNQSAKYASGNLHFTTTLDRDSDFAWNIISVDLRREVCGLVEQPNYGAGSRVEHLGVLGGCICVFINYKQIRDDVWVLKEYNVKESWTKVFSIPSLPILIPFLHRSYLFYKPPLIIMLPNGEVLLECSGISLVYNPKDDSFRCVQITNANHVMAAEIYVESLVSL